ncbi:hypothetical protein H6G96_10200 [Nostoc sp. FACHB-892]|uniref:hypothetical protein n=1 Tax=Nostoc sp. FACHB-892 TaxID=2692843 RepID=UPI0016899929|nr:hypothetical protein [Nostoc sp. FACHB-892]MBD2726691.1 hypothetical protein [Nostoc sp. FACHB-892]
MNKKNKINENSNSEHNLRLSLEQNCYHSLKKGYTLYNEADKTKDGWLLKESLIWIHHGIELGIKLLLVQTNEYLIFENVDIALTQLLTLRQAQPNATILDLFEEPESPRSVTLITAMKRVAIMLKISDLLKDSELEKNIILLNEYRNKIVHYSVNLEFETVHPLVLKAVEQFLSLLENNIKDEQFIKDYLPEIRRIDIPMRSLFEIVTKNVKNRILTLINLFDGQKVSGKLFNLEQDISLPKFEIESLNITEEAYYRVIVEAETLNKEKWIVILQAGVPNHHLIQSLYHTVLTRKITQQDQQEKTIIWLINFSGQHLIKNTICETFQKWDVLISDQGNLQKIEQELIKSL